MPVVQFGVDPGRRWVSSCRGQSKRLCSLTYLGMSGHTGEAHGARTLRTVAVILANPRYTDRQTCHRRAIGPSMGTG
jgi:hypothetical protein